MLERLIESLEKCPIVKRGDYDYFIHPITDGVPRVEPALLRDVCTAMVKVLDLQGVQLFVVAEAMGIHIGTTLSLMTDIPFTIVRKRKYELPGEVAVHQTTGYSKGELYLNGVSRGDRVAIVDDVVSTGGTMRALIQALDTRAPISLISASPSAAGGPTSGDPSSPSSISRSSTPGCISLEDPLS